MFLEPVCYGASCFEVAAAAGFVAASEAATETSLLVFFNTRENFYQCLQFLFFFQNKIGEASGKNICFAVKTCIHLTIKNSEPKTHSAKLAFDAFAVLQAQILIQMWQFFCPGAEQTLTCGK